MNKTDDVGASDTHTRHATHRAPETLGADVGRRVCALADDAAVLLMREKIVTDRENAVHLREEKASARECDMRAIEIAQVASESHMRMLQQANERLLIATLEAQKLARQVKTTTLELESAKCVAEKANLAKSEFLSGMSHELRSPLNAILGFAQLLESGTPPPTPLQKTGIEQILQAGWYLLELINEILDLAMIESGKLSLSMEPMSLSEVLLDCQAMIEPQAQKSGIRMHFPQCDCCYFVNADRTRVKQVLINLLSNAIKYNRVGGTVEVTCTAHQAQRMRISVRDTGEGLSAAKIAQLFQPFNRLGQETKDAEGTGIGLAMSKRLVEAMGGEISMESTVGVGSVFWVDLNLACEPQLPVGAGQPIARLLAEVQPDVALHTLLYVEDNRANLELVKQIIARRPNLRLLSAHDGARGIALACTHLPDVILMDINLPGINGIQALNILRADPATAHIPVLALSANAMPRDIEKGLAAGFFHYLTKPIKVNEFLAALDLALEFAAARSNAASHPELP